MQRAIDERLIVAATCLIDLFSKPCNYIVIESNRNSSFARWKRIDRPSLPLTKIIFVFYCLFLFVLLPFALCISTSLSIVFTVVYDKARSLARISDRALYEYEQASPRSN